MKKVKKLKAEDTNDFPKYLMKVDGERKFFNFREAYVMYDSGSINVEFCRYVLNADFSVRKMTNEDKAKISEAADKYGEGK